MAIKDTVNALKKRGVGEEVATLLANEFHTLAGISDAGVDGIVNAGVSKEEAEKVFAAIGTRKPRTAKGGVEPNDSATNKVQYKTVINALKKRGVGEEVATLLANEFHTLAGISDAGVDGIVNAGVSKEEAEKILTALGTRKARSSKKGAESEPESESTEETAEEEPGTEYTSSREPTPSETRLLSLCDSNNISLPLMVVRDIADRIKDAELDDEVCEKLLSRAQEMYEAHMMAQNESAGVMAAHSIGEPGTQMNLRTFHVAGDASVAVTRGLPRLIEIVDARREPSTPSMTIPLIGLAREDKAIAELVASEIEITTLSNVAEIETDITHLKIRIKFDYKKLDKLNLDLDTVLAQLRKIKAVRGQVAKADSEDEGCDIVISSVGDNTSPFTKLLEMHEAIKNAQLKGVDGITRALVTCNNNVYTIITEGSNMKDVLKIDGVDKDHVMTNSILEIAEVFGIEAARNAIIYEATSTLKDAGLDVDVRHIMLVADLMTNDGVVRAIGRNGISGKKSSVLARAAFEITAAHLLHAAMVGETDNLEGVTENIIVGQPVTLGTGAIKLYFNPDKIKNKEDTQ